MSSAASNMGLSPDQCMIIHVFKVELLYNFVFYKSFLGFPLGRMN
jgi:hypothetical protein